jgi:hypothetical protein
LVVDRLIGGPDVGGDALVVNHGEEYVMKFRAGTA